MVYWSLYYRRSISPYNSVIFCVIYFWCSVVCCTWLSKHSVYTSAFECPNFWHNLTQLFLLCFWWSIVCFIHNLLPQASAVLLVHLAEFSSHAHHFYGSSCEVGKIDRSICTFLPVAPDSAEQANSIICKWDLHSSLWYLKLASHTENRAASDLGLACFREGVRQGQIKTPENFPYVFKLPCFWFSIHLVVTNF